MKERIFHSPYGDEFSKFGSLHLERQRKAAQGVRRFQRECKAHE